MIALILTENLRELWLDKRKSQKKAKNEPD